VVLVVLFVKQLLMCYCSVCSYNVYFVYV